MSRAQLLSQVFIFILSAVVLILIISYGYSAISGFMERQREVLLVDFKNDFVRTAQLSLSSFGSIRVVDFRVPSGVSGLCVFDYDSCSSLQSASLSSASGSVQVPWAIDACKSKSANVFLVPRSVELDVPFIDTNGFVCVESVGGRVSLRFEGKGRTVLVS